MLYISGNKDILAEALYSTIMQLVEDVYTLPTSIVIFFKAAQRHVAQLGINTPYSSLGIKVGKISLSLSIFLCLTVCKHVLFTTSTNFLLVQPLFLPMRKFTR